MPQSRSKRQSTRQSWGAYDRMNVFDRADIINDPGLPGVNLAGDAAGKAAFGRAVRAKAGKPGDYTTEPGGTVKNSRKKR